MLIALTAAVKYHGFPCFKMDSAKMMGREMFHLGIWSLYQTILLLLLIQYGTSPLSLCMHECVTAVQAHLRSCVWRSEVRDVRYLPSSLSTLLFEIGSFTEPKACCPARLGVQRAPGDPPVSTLQLWDYASMSSFSCGCWGFKLKLSYLWGKYFARWSIPLNLSLFSWYN